MTWNVLQSASAQNQGSDVSSLSATLTSNCSSGSTLICAVTCWTRTISTVKDGAGNSFTLVKGQGTGSNYYGSLWILATPAGDVGTKPTITATLSSGDNVAMVVQEVAGILTVGSPVDGTPAGAEITQTSPQSQPSYTSAVAGEYLVAVCMPLGAETITAPSGYTADPNSVNNSGGSTMNCVLAYKSTTGGAESGSWSLTSTSGIDGAFVVAAFKLAPGGKDLTSILPGPTWLDMFKPGMPKPRPPAPPSGPYFGNLPNPASVPAIQPGPAWLDQFKPGMRKPRAWLADPTRFGASDGDTVHATDGGETILGTVHQYDGDTVHATDGGESIDVIAGAADDDTVTGTDAGEQIAQYGNFPSELPLQMLLELLVNGTWVNITSYCQQITNIVITRGQPDETQTITASSMTLTLLNIDGSFSPQYPLGQFYGYIGRNTQIRLTAPNDGTPPYEMSYRFSGEVSAWPPSMDATGNYQVVNITASGIWRRFSQNTATIGSPLTRYYSNLSGSLIPVGYWPCEDASGASQFASGLPGGDPMQWSGSPSLASDSSIEGSDPLPDFNASSWAGTPGSYLTPGSTLYDTPGTYLYTAPGGTTSVKAETWGGGGGGAGSFGTDSAGGGGGGGEYAAEASLAVTAGNQYVVVVGPGGAGGVPSSSGSAGSPSSMAGDSKTVTAHPGGGGGDDHGGSAGTGSANTTHHNGGAGAANGGGGGGYAFYDSSDTWTAPDGVTEVSAYVQAGGGSGGGSEHYYYGNGAGGGGGGGGYSAGSESVTPGSGYSVTVGNGGSASSGTSNGNAGDDSSFEGDSGTVSAGGGQGGFSSSILGGGSGHPAGGPGGSGNDSDGSAGSEGGNYDGGDGGGSASGGGGSGGKTTGAGGAGGAYGGGGGGAGTPAASGPASSGAGAGGSVELSYSAPTTGAGGGGSGGNTSAGNTADTGSGASAVGDGGPGGNGGSGGNGSSPLGGPGGGGGGADAGTYAGGSGASGQVLITTASSTTPTSNVTRFVMNLDASGSVDGTVIAEIDTGGTIAKLTLVYHTGGELELLGYNGSGGTLFDSGAKSVGADGTPMMVSIELDQNGSAATWLLQGVEPDATALLFSYSGSVSSVTLGSVTEVKPNPGGGLTSSMMGQISVQYGSSSLLLMAPILAGYAGELAGDRFLRLCTEEGIPAYVESPTAYGFSDGTTDNWTGTNGAVSNSQVWSSDGDGFSLLLTAAGSAGEWYAEDAGVLACSAGDLVSAYSDVYAPAALGEVFIGIAFLNASGGVISTSSGTGVAVGAGGTASISQTLITAPVNTAAAAVLVGDNETKSSGTLLYLDNVRIDRNPMGPQTDATLVALLQETPAMDGGFIFEPRQQFGLAYCTLANAQNQSAALIMDFSLGQLAQPFSPTEDDQNTRNYIVVQRGTAGGSFTGSTYIAQLSTGALSVLDPPNGVGQYSYPKTVNCYADSQLAAIANQILAVGTVDEMRYPVINVDLSRSEVAALFTDIVNVDAANFIEIDNALPQMGYGPIRQLTLGFTETLNAYVWQIAWNCVPESPYET